MARTRPDRRRRANARAKLNLEIVGIAAIAIAILCGIALAFPHHAGSIGGWTAGVLRRLFGSAAALFPVLVALVGAIVFLEVNVPRMIAGLGSSALAYFLIVDAMFGARGAGRGGIVGANIWWALRALVGPAGAWILLVLAALSLTLWLTNASMKQLIGRAIVFFGGWRPPPVPNFPRLREAFALPERSAAVAEIEPQVVETRASIVEEKPVFVEEIELPARLENVVASNPGLLVDRPYRLPDLAIFDVPPHQTVDDSNRAHVLEDTLAASASARRSCTSSAALDHALRAQARARRQDFADRVAGRRLGARAGGDGVRIEAPIPGKSAVGIEVPNPTVSLVAIREILDALPNRGKVPPLYMALGKDITGRPVFGDLARCRTCSSRARRARQIRLSEHHHRFAAG